MLLFDGCAANAPTRCQKGEVELGIEVQAVLQMFVIDMMQRVDAVLDLLDVEVEVAATAICSAGR